MPHAADYLLNKYRKIILRTPNNTYTRQIIRQETPVHGKTGKIPLPLPISINHNRSHLYINLLYVNGMKFLHTKSVKISLLSDQHCISWSTR